MEGDWQFEAHQMLSGQKAAEMLPLSSLYLILNVKIQKTHRAGSFLFSSDSKLMGISEKGNKYPSMKQKKTHIIVLPGGIMMSEAELYI